MQNLLKTKSDARLRRAPAVMLLLAALLASSPMVAAKSQYYLYAEVEQTGGEVEVSMTHTAATAYDTVANHTWDGWRRDDSGYLDLQLVNNSSEPRISVSDHDRYGASNGVSLELIGLYDTVARTELNAAFSTPDLSTPEITDGSLLRTKLAEDAAELLLVAGPNLDDWSMIFNVSDGTNAVAFDVEPTRASRIHVNGTEVRSGEVVLTEPAWIEVAAIDEDFDDFTMTPIRIRNTTTGAEYPSKTRVSVVSNTSVEITVIANATITGSDNVVFETSFVHSWGKAPHRDAGLVKDGQLHWCREAPSLCYGEVHDFTALDDGDSLVMWYEVTTDAMYGLQKLGGYESAHVTLEMNATGSRCAKTNLKTYFLNAEDFGGLIDSNYGELERALDDVGYPMYDGDHEPRGSYEFSSPTSDNQDATTAFGTRTNADCYDDGEEISLDFEQFVNWSTGDRQDHYDAGWYDGDTTFSFAYVVTVDYLSASSDEVVLQLIDGDTGNIVARTLWNTAVVVNRLQVEVIFVEEPTIALSTNSYLAEGTLIRCDVASPMQGLTSTKLTVEKKVDGEWVWWGLEPGHPNDGGGVWMEIANDAPSSEVHKAHHLDIGGEIKKRVNFEAGEWRVMCQAWDLGYISDQDVTYLNLSISTSPHGGILDRVGPILSLLGMIVLVVAIVVFSILALSVSPWFWLGAIAVFGLLVGVPIIDAWNSRMWR